MKLRERIAKFFYPEPGSPPWRFILPFATLIVLFIAVTFGGIHTWEYTNSNQFCGTACHTMPPQEYGITRISTLKCYLRGMSYWTRILY